MLTLTRIFNGAVEACSPPPQDLTVYHKNATTCGEQAALITTVVVAAMVAVIATIALLAHSGVPLDQLGTIKDLISAQTATHILYAVAGVVFLDILMLTYAQHQHKKHLLKRVDIGTIENLRTDYNQNVQTLERSKNQEIVTLTQAYETEKNTLMTANKALTLHIEQDKDKFELKNALSKTTIITLTQQNAEHIKDSLHLKKTLTERDTRITQLEGQIATLENEKVIFEKIQKTQIEKIKILEAQINNAKSEIEKLQKTQVTDEVQEKLVHLAKLEKKHEELNKEFDNLTETNKLLDGSTIHHRDEAKKLKETNKLLKEQQNEVEKELATKEKELISVRNTNKNDLEIANTEIEKLKREITALKTKQSELNDKNATLTNQNEILDKFKTTHDTKIKELEIALNYLEIKAQENANNAKLEEEKLNREIKTLQDKLVDFEKMKKDLEQQHTVSKNLIEAKNKAEQAAQEANTKYSEQEKVLNNNNLKLTALEEEVKKSQINIQTLQEEKTALESSKKIAEENAAAFAEDLTKLNTEKMNLQEKLEELKKVKARSVSPEKNQGNGNGLTEEKK